MTTTTSSRLPSIIVSATADLMSRATGVSLSTIIWVMRTLRNAKLISDGRAVGGMKPQDSSRILISIMASGERPADAARAVETFGALISQPGRPTGEQFTNEGSIKLPTATHTFDEGVAHLISELANRSRDAAQPRIDLTININQLFATIETGGFRYQYAHKAIIEHVNEKARDIEPFFALRRQYQNAKIRTSRTITEDVLAEVAEYFRKGRDER